MADNPFIEIDAPHLCVMENEADELINEGTYGKALAEYLQAQLKTLGYTAPGGVCEDWGWYVSAEIDGFQMGICVYGLPRDSGETGEVASNQDASAVELGGAPAGTVLALCIQVDTQPRKYWDWRRLRRVDRSDLVAKLNSRTTSDF